MDKLSIVIPAYNEAKTIRRLVEKIMMVNFPIENEIIIVDDYSRDRTYRVARILNKRDLSNRIRLFRNERNRGKGYCIRRGFENARGNILVVQDADFEYDPREIPRLLEPILNGKADVVYGSRFLGAKRPEGMGLPSWMANRVLTGLTNALFGSKLTDMETCYKLLRKDVLEGIRLRAERFDFEPEITTKILKKKYAILELPIPYRGRSAAEGKKIKARDFFIALWVLWSQRFSSA